VCARRAASLVAAPLWSLASAETVEHHHRHHRSQQQQRSTAHHHPSTAPPQPFAIPSPATTGSGGDGLGLTARPSGDDGIGGVVDSAAPSICSEEVVVIDEEDDEEESGMSPVGCSGSVPSDERCVVGLRSENPATAGASQGCPRQGGEPNSAKVKGNGESVGVSGYLAGETRHLQELRVCHMYVLLIQRSISSWRRVLAAAAVYEHNAGYARRLSCVPPNDLWTT
jgi:hypothetical protein